MKALAARVERDTADLVALYDASEFASVEEALDHLAAPHFGSNASIP